MKFIIYALLIVAIIHVGCEPGPETTSASASGSGAHGGFGGKEVSSSSSSSSSSSGDAGAGGSDAGFNEFCNLEYVTSVCLGCKAMGCPSATDNDEACHRIGVIHYTDMIGCIQQIPGVCPMCPANPMPGDVISDECAKCARQYTDCSFRCDFEVNSGCKTPEGVVASCKACMDWGCETPLHQPGQCDEAVNVYETFITCASLPAVQASCPACSGIGVSTPMPIECSDCAKKLSTCSFDCAAEILK